MLPSTADQHCCTSTLLSLQQHRAVLHVSDITALPPSNAPCHTQGCHVAPYINAIHIDNKLRVGHGTL
jgi:hypothetical protein